MQLTEIRINLSDPRQGRLKAFCSLTFDQTFVVRDVKLIEGPGGLFLAMPSRKLTDRCPRCSDKNHLRARFCNHCGARLDEHRAEKSARGNALHAGRFKLHADIAHPINVNCRTAIEREVVDAYSDEIERSKQPGYVPPNLDGEDFDFYDTHPAVVMSESSSFRPTGTESH
jgi:stage V sporulation protein G